MKPNPPNEPAIFTIRDQRVVLDADLARIYGVPTSQFNQAFKRNRHRFPDDFAFQLNVEEIENLRSQIVTSSLPDSAAGTPVANWSQFATGSGKHGGRRSLPWVFTEHGALMAANILRSERAVEMSVYVVRAFVRQRALLATNADILRRLAEIDRTLLGHDEALRTLWQKLQPLLAPPPEKPRRRIGFHP